VSRIFQFLTILILLLVDQVFKLFFSQQDGIVMNYGGVFGLFPGLSWTGLLAVVLLYLMVSLGKAKEGIERWGLMLIVAGGLANMVDRILIGGVRDFIYWPILNVWGNMADLWLTVGVGLLVIDSIRNQIRR
jgi:signal peptidase II